jgi:sugar/nucleoside kinase (ribokinase family)
LYSALAARLWEHPVGCVSVLGSDYPREALDRLRARGVDFDGVRTLGQPGGRAWILYEGAIRQLVHRLGRPSHEALSPVESDIPDSWRAARAFHLAPMPFEVHQRHVQALRARTGAFVSVDPHRPITETSLDDWRALLSDVDAFFPSEDELQIEQALRDPQMVLPKLATGRLRFVIFKRGDKGGTLYDAHERRFHSWTARAASVTDPTGAGDAFAIGFVSAHLDGLSVERSLQRAVVTASVAIERWGPDALMTDAREAACRRLVEWYRSEAES